MKTRADWLENRASQRVFELFEQAGHQAYAVGGCVRNTLLNAPVTDIDISTDARPEQVTGLAKGAGLKVVPTGIEHGTVTVIVDSTPFEITTFRKDVETDGRRAVVAFSDTLEDDARRRDFTMNALYMDATGQVHDPVGGLPDLKARLFRFIDDADQRIREDYLRILRFFRFHAWYGDPEKGLDPDALAACAANVDGIDQLSKERIGQEMRKLLAAPDPAPAAASMAACGALLRVLPGASADALAVLRHLEEAQGLQPDAMRRLAVMGGHDQTTHLRLTNSETRKLETFLSPKSALELGYRYGALGIDILCVRSALMGVNLSPQDLDDVNSGIGQSFPVKANDLMPELMGKSLGEELKKMEERWIESRFTLSKAQLLS